MSECPIIFYPDIHLEEKKYPHIVFANTEFRAESSRTHLIVNSFISLEDLERLNESTKKKNCRQPSRVIGFVESPNRMLSNHGDVANDYRLSFEFSFMNQSDGTVDGFSLKSDEGDVLDKPQSVRVIIYRPSELICLHARTSHLQNVPHDCDWIIRNLFVNRKFCLPKPYVDLRISPIKGQNEVKNKELGTMGRFIDLSTTISHLINRYNQVNHLFHHQGKPMTVEAGDTLSSLLFDIALGMIFTYLLITRVDTLTYIQIGSNLGYNFISQLEKLINHLILMPVGLKLNSNLNKALGNFFLYHIYLLRTYLYLIHPVYTTVIQLLPYIGLFGFTFILTVSCDIFSLITIHSWCFYGYAAHVYSFNVKSLICLWRLFRGKKWNQLKSRVDSYSYQTDQLLIGGLSFTILLFLLPTVLIYYSVFLLLRLVMLSVTLILRFLVYILSTFPFYSLCLKVFDSKRIATSVIMHQKNNQYQLITQTPSLNQLLSHAYSSNVASKDIHLNNLLLDAVQGNVISFN